MKPKNKLLILIVFLLSVSCDNVIDEPTDITNYESEDTFYKAKGFTELSPNDPLVLEAVYSLTSKINDIYKDKSNLYFSSRLNRINEVGMFEYENGVQH